MQCSTAALAQPKQLLALPSLSFLLAATLIPPALHPGTSFTFDSNGQGKGVHTKLR
jgi:hypothetical protein